MSTRSTTPVAVIGMACRLPGGIDSPEQLWEALCRGDDLVTEVPRDRWDNDEYFDPEPGVPGRTTSKWGAFLDDVAGFDAEFFGVNEREAAALDPQHRLLLETSWEAMEHAGLTPEAVKDSLTGVFTGLTHYDYQLVSTESDAMEGPFGFSGSTFSMASGRIAYTLGLHGPAMAVDTACSSGLFAVHMGCRSLTEGESDLALAGGAYVMLDPRKYVSGTAAGQLSPTGRCHAFDVSADGYVGGEACAMVLLKRLPDAVRDGDRILAVIRGTAANQDGHTAEISTPSVAAQAAVYRAALAGAGVEAGSVGMVEAHGPGTQAGDRIEYTSLSEVYGLDGPCALGSVKTNFGHSQSAAGAIGLVKTILALQHGAVPRNLHFTRLPDDLARISTKLFVPVENTDWPTGSENPRRAAVSSYGVSGTNVHAVLEQAPDPSGAQTTSAEGSAPAAPLLFPLSSSSAEELRRTAGRLAHWVQQHDDVALPDLGYTLARRRGHRPVRAAVHASSRTELAEALRELADGDTRQEAALAHDDLGPVWVFSGQGSQWARMGAQLLAIEPVFAATVAQLEPLIAAESGFSVTTALTAPEVVAGDAQLQPTLFTVQVALAAALKAYGARPGAVIGYSMGEVAAAVVAGALSLEDGVRVICRRSRLTSGLAGSGIMAAVELPAKQVLSELTLAGIKDVVVGVVAAPESTVVSGATQTVRDLMATWEERDVTVRQSPIDVAEHSPLVDPILDEFATALAEIKPLTPQVPFYSATGFDPREEPVCNNKYWVRNLRNTVRFAAAARAAVEDGYRVFAELAPHPMLTETIERTADSLDAPVATFASLRREQTLPHGLRGLVSDLHGAGAAVDFSVLYPNGRLVDAPLPTWTRRRLWLDHDRDESTAHGDYTVSVHPLLGPHVRLQEEPQRHVWQAEVGTAAQPWLADHTIRNVAVLPAAAYCEMALAAAHTVLGEAAEVRDIRFEHALLLDEQTTVGASAALSSPGVVEFLVDSEESGHPTRHASAILHAADDDELPAAYDIAALLAAHPHHIDGAEVGDGSDPRGVHYGPAFTGLSGVNTGEDSAATVLAEVALPRQMRMQQGAYGVHPALLDACFQALAASPQIRAQGVGVLGWPQGARRLRSFGSARGAHYCYARITGLEAAGIEADLDLLDAHGAVLLTVQGLRCGTGESEQAQQDRILGERLLAIDWQQRQLPEPSHVDAGTWLLISTTDTADLLGARLTDSLKSQGVPCNTMCWSPNADHAVNAGQLAERLQSGRVTGAVILTGTKASAADDQTPRVGREYVQHLTRITRELAQTTGHIPHLFVVTRAAQTVLAGDVANLEQGGLRGLVRVIGAEHPHLHATQIDVDDSADAEQLARHLLSGSKEDETAWRDGVWYTARLRHSPLRPDERQTAFAANNYEGMRLHIRTPGDLESLELVACERVTPGPGQIEVAVGASSVNFADVLVAMGLFPAIEGGLPELGMDFAGVVTAVGPGVTNHRVGDRVGGFSANGCWGTFVTCDARLAVTLPEAMTDHQAAAAATATTTAWYALHDQARIAAGDRVLIHSATGGLGQAAIGVARAAGAEIFATAGSEDRRKMLRDMGITHVYDSRSTEFADQIRRDTDGYGVDIVLNSLTGAAQRAGIELLATGGRFVEIGKRDVYANSRLGLFPFRRNLTFCYVDLALMSSSHPQRVGELLRTAYQLVASGDLPPARHTEYPLADAATAIRMMSAAQHTGKLVLDIPRTGTSRVVIPPEQAAAFRRDGAYLVTGGLSGLGLFLAEKMADAGCGRIVLTSRSQPTLKALETIELIRAMGSEVVVHCGDIADPATAQRMVEAATATGLPVRGVLHAAAVIEDATLANITDDLVEREWAPKVYGIWNLHAATADQPLDWFCSFSSAAALMGSPGQGAYAAANSWLGAFTRWRRSQGRPGTTIAWGAWGQIGHATHTTENAGTPIAPDEGAYALDVLLRHQRAYTGYVPIDGSTWLTDFAQRSPFAEAFSAVDQGPTGTSSLRVELSGLPREEWPARLRRLISDQVSLILRRNVEPDRPLAEYGVDSLGALELRTRIEAETGVRLTSGDLAVGTIRGLAEVLCERLAPTNSDASA
ncbi:sulfolipid-1 biosynthesis phthioceranic/hydroxyphthioceranic acid synthase [Mycobacterium sp. CVI_P3]|uniref:Sulfolipid-1 biosynthesis phthioceranic/hydroxyphthioceranic acid synthase n=2 Tax=Mycobacterium pinniadriaticum TaxID=2994102 RepID=A0ABT3SKF2_9MYCO|nr:sulfolipid-1 biosynthesis phthioceranic/hydroxyphthioceranic acid synthase [Mycobacterium pinniadriaticum]MCX2940004.1 sulfolipid-1 biosynthesis phthioceranic/hydroxyphthioceranic acid synthase [Mycobacterium pinniadriaticum]